MVLNLVQQAEALKKQQVELRGLAKNPFQPPPVLEEVDAMVNQEKRNEELEPDEVQITLSGSLAATGASYVKYYLTYEQGKVLEGHY